jgi:hypothetical protein
MEASLNTLGGDVHAGLKHRISRLSLFYRGYLAALATEAAEELFALLPATHIFRFILHTNLSHRHHFSPFISLHLIGRPSFQTLDRFHYLHHKTLTYNSLKLSVLTTKRFCIHHASHTTY